MPGLGGCRDAARRKGWEGEAEQGVGSWSGRHGRRFGWRGQAEGLDSGRLEAGEWDCLGIVVGVRSYGAENERGDIYDDI